MPLAARAIGLAPRREFGPVSARGPRSGLGDRWILPSGSGVQANLVGRNTIEPRGLVLWLPEILCVPGVLRRVEVVQKYDGEAAIAYFLVY